MIQTYKERQQYGHIKDDDHRQFVIEEDKQFAKHDNMIGVVKVIAWSIYIILAIYVLLMLFTPLGEGPAPFVGQ